MASQTPRFKVPFPNAEDAITAYPATGRALADRIDAMQATGSVPATVWSASSGWSLTSQFTRVSGCIIVFAVGLTRTGAAITVGATGDVGNVQVAQLNVAGIGNGSTNIAAAGPLSPGAAGRVASMFLSGAGQVTLAATTPGGSIVTGEQLSFTGIAFTN